jgi:hypothetical protein
MRRKNTAACFLHLPAWFLRRTVVNYIMASRLPTTNALLRLPRHLIDARFHKIQRWPFVYKFSVHTCCNTKPGKIILPGFVLQQVFSKPSPN